MNFKKSLKSKGYIFINLDSKNQLFVKKINHIILNYLKKKKIQLSKLNSKDFISHIFYLQKKINEKNIVNEFFEINKKKFKEIYSEKNYMVQTYFYLRAVPPKKSKQKINPINFHRETFNTDASFKKIYNLWIPLMNCTNNNSMNYYPLSHKMEIDKDFKIIEYKTKVKKKSKEHKLGYLYKERKIIFKKKTKFKRLFKKKSFLIFTGELIHGSGDNHTNKTRFSIDLRFIKKKNLNKNFIQGSNNKKYFKHIKI